MKNTKRKQHLFLMILIMGSVLRTAAQVSNETIVVQTSHTSLVFSVKADGSLVQSYFGKRLATDQLADVQATSLEAYPAYGKSYVFEPAFRAVHADGNLTTEL